MNILVMILGILGMISGLWVMVGTPIGVILGIVYLLRKDKKDKSYLKWIKISFGGLLAMLVVMIAWGVLNFLAVMNGWELPTAPQ